ncbi:MAG: HIRAN domain-containing protein, partial [Nocardioidaceae bacterium]
QPHMLVPVNLPPPGSHQLLPPGSAVVVPGSGDHPDVLAPFFRTEGECWAYATLHATEEENYERPKMVVEVRLDDDPVGRLSPKLSSEFLPAIHYLADMRAETAARVIVRGDRLSAEVILYAARSHDLPATWPDGLTRSPVAAPGWHYWIGKAN